MSGVGSGASTASAKPLGHILVVEDEHLIGLLMADQLDELGYGVVGPAFSLEEGRRLAASAPIDCALLDWNLAGSSSGEVADILTRRRIPFVFVTGYAKLPDASYRDIGVLNKPFGLSDLQRAIEKALPGRTTPARRA
jgi:CheY-like chemotaxis protein